MAKETLFTSADGKLKWLNLAGVTAAVLVVAGVVNEALGQLAATAEAGADAAQAGITGDLATRCAQEADEYLENQGGWNDFWTGDGNTWDERYQSCMDGGIG